MNVIKFLRDFIDMNPDVKSAKLARWVGDNYPDFPYTSSSTERMLQRIKKGDDGFLRSKKDIDLDEFPLVDISSGNTVPQEDNIDINDIDVIVEEEEMKLEAGGTSYTYDKGIYVLGGELHVSGELISKLFTDYPRKGLNLSRTALINKYDLGKLGENGPSVLGTIQRKLGLYKDSNIVAPHLFAELTPEELDSYMDSQLDTVINNPEYIEKKYHNRVMANYRNVINQASLKEIEFYNKIEEIAKTFNTVDRKISLSHTVTGSDKTCVVTIADVHAGASVKDVQRTHDFNSETIRKRLGAIADAVNEGGYSNVNIAIMGDMFQGSAFNHIGAGNTIAEQYAEQFKLAYELMVEFLSKVHNISAIYAVGGNHDRGSSDNRQDQKSSMLDILVFMLSKIIKMPIEFHHDTISFVADGVCYILQHGHFNYHKKNAADIILDHGKPEMFNMILRGHLHSLQVANNDDRRNYRRIVVPSIYTGEDYSSTGGWSNNAGFTIFETTNLGSLAKKAPKMIVESLQ